MNAPKIVALSGSLRADSLNTKLLAVASAAAREAGAEVTTVNLRELALPIFDQDCEDSQGLPEGAKTIKSLLRASDGLLVASPEYNSSVTAALKNAIDWASRAESDDEPPLAAFRGKGAALISASPGGLGGIRGLVHLRAILGNIGMHVLPDQVMISSAHEAFDESGALKDPGKSKQIAELARGLVQFLEKHRRA